ncbi:DUF4224 domain-containing protein [Ramlibacter sp.]|uniref:DUF4224 domain-containing protein n=1 Tax=Ramlibacter sp. TaxID=1917967 RepID=UPI002622FD2E|nr:DUF4224 domain-containing protein [Ramlibacter sp.]MDB5957699.1 hypothetical protein [Ramlibacter sp.]
MSDQLPSVSEFLDKPELRQLTGRARANAQTQWLESNDVPHRRDGSRIIVSRYHVRQWLEGKPAPPSPVREVWNAAFHNEVEKREVNFRGHSQRIQALRAIYGPEIASRTPGKNLACPAFYKISTEAKAFDHHINCVECRALLAPFLPEIRERYDYPDYGVR